MPRYRALVSTFKSTEMAIDRITNTLYFDDTGLTTDAGAIATDIAELFATYRPLPTGFDKVNCRLYDMAEPIPREIQGEHTTDVTSFQGAAGPREVALCLSFYSQRPLPRNRGRLFIGPWAQSQMQERPQPGPHDALNTLKTGLANIGSLDVKWCVYSPTTGPASSTSFKQISAGWIDDEWDTVRSRGLKATVRGAWTMEG